MELIKEKDRRTITPLPHVTIYEYDTQDGFISGATAVIKGRYPEKGFVMNRTIKELVYVLEGSGQLIMPDKTVSFAKGDTLFLDHKEKYAWEGDMVLFMATTPRFDPAQHEECA